MWEVVSDISRNPDWQLDCREVIFLTSKRSGPGLRWRYSDEKRREFVYEVSAWYAGLGYEYYFVDGPSFKDARGRIRLQEIPEGTIVQWTFSYEVAGMFSGVRDSAIDKLIQDSLRQLWQMLKTSPRALADHQAKSLMRDAPDVEARTAYQPRHPSAVQEDDAAPPTKSRPTPPPASWERVPDVPIQSEPSFLSEIPPERVLSEPPVTHEDTKPNPVAITDSRRVITDDAAMIPNDLAVEPEFLGALEDLTRFEPPPTSDATQPRSVSSDAPPVPIVSDTVPTKPMPEPEPDPSSRVPSMNRHLEIADAMEPVADLPVPPVEAVPPSVEAPITDKTPTVDDSDTLPLPSQISAAEDTRSIWEIFNVSRPSDIDDAPRPESASPTPQVEATQAEASVDAASIDKVPVEVVDETVTPITAIPAVPSFIDTPTKRVHLATGSRGLRQTIRNKTVRIRRPT